MLSIALIPLAFANTPASAEPGACLTTAGAEVDAVAFDWRVVVDASAGWAVLLPASHQVGSSDGTWYVFETLDGIPLVPDVTIRLHRGRGVEELAGELFGDAAVLELVRMGPATLGYRASVRPETGVESYLVANEAGVYSISRYEGFDWDGFGPVACSFHFVDLVGSAEAKN